MIYVRSLLQSLLGVGRYHSFTTRRLFDAKMPVASRANCGKVYVYERGRMRSRENLKSPLEYRHMFYMFVLVNAILIYRYGRLTAVSEKLCLPSKLNEKGEGEPTFKPNQLKQQIIVKDPKLKCLEKLYQNTKPSIDQQTKTGNNSLNNSTIIQFDVENETFDCNPDADPTRNTMITRKHEPSYMFRILRDFAMYKDPDAIKSLSLDDAPLKSNPVFDTLLSATTF